MSHVDEGTLHAYLDGELPSTEKAALEAHLAQCADCRASLAEEQALLERASALLGSARPVERAAPPFEQLRRSPRRSPWHVRMPFAWAASITLALGLGYYLRSPEYAPAPAPRAPDSRLFAHYNEVPVAAQKEEDAAVMRQRQSRQRVAPTASRPDALEQLTESASVDKAGAASGVVAIQPPVQLRGRAPAALAAPSVANDISGAQARDNLAALRGRVVATEWPIISRGAARTLLGTDPVGLPGLATRKIRRSPAADGTVVVEQALDSSTVIQIFQRPVGAPTYVVDGYRLDSSAKAAPAAREMARVSADRLARFVGRLRVEIAGPLSPDSLNRLLEQVEPLP